MTVPAAVIATSVRPCPQCGRTTVQPIHEGRFLLPEGHPLESVVRVVACEGCGFCFNDTPCTREDYGRYYHEISKDADPRLSSGACTSPEDALRLEAAGRPFWDLRPQMVIEPHMNNGKVNTAALTAILRRNDYNTTVLPQAGLHLPLILATPND